METTIKKGNKGYEATMGPENDFTGASFQLSRPLRPTEQFDISTATDLEKWIPGNHASSCPKWLRSYFANDPVQNCQNVGQTFTCYNIWSNQGLA
jgi:hypothetical protein